MSVAFVICVEAGSLEEQSVLFAESVRRWGGRYADARIVSLEPRGPSGMREATRSALTELSVEHHDETLNHDFPNYPIANKVFAAAWAERNLSEDVIAVCDTDTFFVNEPERLEVGAGLAARPVWQKKRGSTGPEDSNDAYWERMYEICGVAARPWVTIRAGTQIRAYFNSGLVAVRREEGILAAWLQDFLTLMEARYFPDYGRRNMDQLALAVTSARAWDRVRILEPTYNYMLRRRPRMPEPDRSIPLEDLVHVHYRKWLAVPGFLEDLEPKFPDGDRLSWLKARLPLRPVGE